MDAWVIEHGDSKASFPEYWNGTGWSPNHLLAIRFCRDLDARRVSTTLPVRDGGPEHRVVERRWD